MLKFNMLSSVFEHNGSSTVNQKPSFFEWDFKNKTGDIDFYIDGDIHKAILERNNGRKKILWTLESPHFNNGVFDYIKNNLNIVLEVFEFIFTYNEEFLKIDKKFNFVPAMGSWVKNPQLKNKTKLISMVTSNKTITPQQKYRVDFANSNKNKIDIYGRGFKEILNKEEGLEDYMFSVCIENATTDTYFTEKILDCFALGTIPIYKGSKNIINHFDVGGILFLDDVDLKDISENLYISKYEHIKNNFNKVKNLIIPEDIIYKIIKK
jgi:hypothetical protein